MCRKSDRILKATHRLAHTLKVPKFDEIPHQMKALFILATIILFHTRTEAQLCGGGTFTFSFYSLNGTFVKEIQYDFYEVHRDSLKSAIAQKGGKGSILLHYYGSAFAINTIDDIVIAGHKTGKIRANELNKMSGKVAGSKLEVKTRELNDRPILLRIISAGKTQYFISSFFGGCYGSMNILLN